MNKKTTIARIRPDGKVVRVAKDGREESFPDLPIRPMTDAEVTRAAYQDPDARPMTRREQREAKRVPQVKTLRRALGMTQETFALRFQIPIGTLRDWEQGRAEPDQPTRAYLKVIAQDPERVYRLLNSNRHR